MDHDRLLRIARQLVETDRLLGVEAVPVGSPPALQTRDEPDESTADAPAPPPVSRAKPSDALFAGAPAQGEASHATSSVFSAGLSRDEKVAALRALDENEVKGCTKCDLCQGRTQTVFGEGDPDAPILFIGEGPGQNEDEQGRPFVGRAGDLLNKMIKAMGYDREQVFIANVVKCRPPNNRTPSPAEVDACWDYLRRQIEIIRPRAIVTLGGPAAKMLLNTKIGITRLRGTWHTYDGLAPHGPPIPLMPTFHPAYLLRAYTPDNRKTVWSDLQKVMGEVNDE